MTRLLLSVPWYVPIALYCLIAYVGVRWLGKHLADQPDQLKRLTTNFAFCALFGAAFAAATGQLYVNAEAVCVMLIGILNASANIAQWRANRVSMSKTSLLSFGDDIVATLLAMTPVVGDARFVNATTGAGITLCIATGILFWWHSFRGGESVAFYKNVLIYSLCWGVADVSQRYFAIKEMPIGQFVFSWYLGSFFTMGTLFVARALWQRGSVNEAERVTFRLRDVAWVALFATGIAVCLAIEYWAKMLAPQTVIGPTLLVAEATVPTAIGLRIFKEHRTFDRYQWSFLGVGILGVVFLALGFANT